MKDEIHDIISRANQIKYGSDIQTILGFLTGGQESGSMVKTDKHFKKEETKRLINFIESNNLWVSNIDLNNYISEGAEQKVFLQNGKTVFKLNDAIYYTSWVDYFHNLLLNNYFFPDTAYHLLGFFENESVLFAVVEQAYIKATEKTDLSHVKQFMINNGFENVRNNDFFNRELGLILEDLHDENVLTQNGVLFFIDTVFYIV